MAWLELGIEFQLESFIGTVSTGLVAALGRTMASLLLCGTLTVHRRLCPNAQTHQHELMVLFRNPQKRAHVSNQIWYLNSKQIKITHTSKKMNVIHKWSFFRFGRNSECTPWHWVRLVFGGRSEQALQEPLGGAETRGFLSQTGKRVNFMVKGGERLSGGTH